MCFRLHRRGIYSINFYIAVLEILLSFLSFRKGKHIILNSDWQCCYGLTIAVKIGIHIDSTVIGLGDSSDNNFEQYPCLLKYALKHIAIYLVESHDLHQFSSLGHISFGKQDGNLLTNILKASQ